MHREWMNKLGPNFISKIYLWKLLDFYSNYNTNLLSIIKSFFQWPNCTAPLFCFYTINLKLWQGSVTPILCGRDLREKAADFLHPLTVEPTETQKYQIFQMKFGETRGKTLFVVVSGEKIQAQWKKKGILFFRWELWKINESPAIFFPGHTSLIRF